MKNIQLDVSAYLLDTQAVIVNEANDNVVSFQDVSIIGSNKGIGIELQSDNCIVNYCNITHLKDGIYINNSNRHSIAGNTCDNNSRYGIRVNNSNYSSIIGGNLCGNNSIYGIYLDTITYCTISGNICSSNQTGIYIIASQNNTISSNTCNSNSQNGIYLTGSSYNTISSNTLENNDSNTPNAQAGLYITSNSNYNTITANSVNNNNNLGAGTGYGILIATATCEENVIAGNNANGNDVDYQDSGTATTVEYYVQNVDELQDAINSIGDKAGVVNLDASFTVSATININGNGSYLIEGEGDNTILTTSGDISCFNITLARQVILKNFKINANSLVSATKEIINVIEGANHLVILDNITITGNNKGYGIELNSNNCRIENCNISSVNIGININSQYNILRGNTTNSNASYGIKLNSNYNTLIANISNSNTVGYYLLNANYNLLNGNTANSNTLNGMHIYGCNYNIIEGNFYIDNDSNTPNPQAGIYIKANSNHNHIIGNSSLNNNNAGAGIGYGIYIESADCDNNIIEANSCSENDIQYWDLGTNTNIVYRCSTVQEIQDAINSIATKTGTIEIFSGAINISSKINVNGGGSYIIRGYGDNTILTTNGDIICFDITNAIYCELRNMKINASSLTTAGKEIVNIAEGSNNRILIDNIIITGNNIIGTGIEVNSNNVIIKNCNIQNVKIGILVNANYCWITDNYCSLNADIGIKLSGNFLQVYGNQCLSNTNYGIYIETYSYGNISKNICNLNAIGMYIVNADYDTFIGNICNDNTNIGIYFVDSNNHSILGNECSGNLDGIRIYNVDYCSIVANICIYNFSNDGNNHAGIYIERRSAPLPSTANTISANTCNGNTNSGAGVSYGIYIGISCNNNIVSVNSHQANDVDYQDDGTGTRLFGDDTVYGASWLNNLGTATKNALYNKIESVIAGYPLTFKTITGITNDVIADVLNDILTLASGNNILSILGDAGLDKITFTINQANINHNALLNYVADRHKLESEMNLANLGTKSHTSLTDKGTNTHAQIDTHITNKDAELSTDLSPQLGGDLDLNIKSILVNGTLASNGNYEGLVLDNITNATAFGTVVYISSANTVSACDKDSINLAIGISVGTGKVLIKGTIKNTSWNWASYIGKPIYIGDSGALTGDISAYSTGDLVQVIGVALDTYSILVKGIDWVEVA